MQVNTMKRYIVPVVPLLAMSFRMHAMEMYAPYEDVKTGILQLQTMLKKREEQVEVIMKIHSVLLGLWTIKWGKKRDGQITIVDPTEHCLALLMLKDSGSFKEPNELTGLIFKFEYCMHLTFLYELYLRVNGEKDEDHACDELNCWFIEHKCSTFPSLLSLQHMASITTVTANQPFTTLSDCAHMFTACSIVCTTFPNCLCSPCIATDQ